MIHELIAIYDLKAQLYGKPVCVVSDASAIRSFGDAVNDPQTEYNKHPEDYILFNIGQYDDSTGNFEQSTPTELAKALALKERATPPSLAEVDPDQLRFV
jgi:hypothetical protein